MLKILHTSDLHIGKRLYQAELYEEQQLFFDWLTDFIRDHQIDALLVSGDVFDVANPSSESRRVYYDLLRRLMMLNCKVVITGGNHDSPNVLEAPSELLKHLDIYVAGGLSDEPGRLLVPLQSKDGKAQLVVACLPYLRDADLRRYNQDETYADRVEAIRQGITSVFTRAADLCREKYPGMPAIAMGHLYVQGSDTSESERDIQIGNLAGLDVKHLPAYFSYYALGHLHKPQQPAPGFVYSGAPVQLSFSEAENQNRVVMITVDEQTLDYESIEVPRFRNLVRMEDTVEGIRNQLLRYTPKDNTLKDFIELVAKEENHDPSKVIALESMIDEFANEGATILKYRIIFKNKPTSMTDLYDENQDIAAMKPLNVFRNRLDKENLDEKSTKLLMEAFTEIMEEVEQKTEE